MKMPLVDELPRCDVRRATCDVPVANTPPQHAEAQPVLAVDNVAQRTSHVAPVAIPLRRVRRLRVGKDGFFPW